MYWILFWTAAGIGLIGHLIFMYITYRSKKQNNTNPIPVAQPPIVNVDLKPILNSLDNLPHKVLQSIQSSSNTYKGAVGELIGYMKLHAEYDRIVPLNNIVDFMCIKLPTETEEGHIDFIDIKTGEKSRLSKDQRALQSLIKDKRVNFIKMKIQTTHTMGVPTIED